MGKENSGGALRLWLTDSRRYRLVWAAAVALICVVISLFYLFSYRRLSAIYENEASATIVALKKVFLKSTVDNLIGDIEAERAQEAERCKDTVDQRYEVYSARSLACGDFVQSFIKDFQSESHTKQWSAFVWDDSGAVLYDPAGYFEKSAASTVERIKPLMSHYRVIHHEDASCLFGITNEYAEGAVKRAAAAKIKSLHFGNDSYIWVNEVVNYGGGKDYAVRRVHPNLPETEGMLLSTDMEDIAGNLPYLTELEGVKKDGELFFSYNFKELNSSEISEKLTYAKLYKEYDWIVAMGVQNNEMERYVSLAGEKSRALALGKAVELLAILLAVVLACLILVFLIERWHLRHSKKQLELEFQLDTLTNAKNRRFGVKYLEEAFGSFKNDGGKPAVAVMLFDIDNFKNINDRHGHSEGDRVLKEIVPAVCKAIRSSDELFRWGGDEFVGVFRVADEGSSVRLMEKILAAVSSLHLKTGDGMDGIETTISIGVSHFKSGDDGYFDALNRADKAMYRSKAEGGDRVTVL